MENKPLLSVIIPTFNAEKHIGRCLRSIKNQTYKKVEIIIVDQSSEDKTLDIAKRYTKNIIMREKPKFYSPPSFSRNLGFENSKGNIIFNIDADMEMPSNLIENCVEMIKNGFDALIMHEEDIALNFWSECRALEKRCMVNDPYMEGARVATREIFKKVKGYDSSLGSGEDWDINARLKKAGKVGYADVFIKHHTGKKHLFNNFKKMVSYGITFDRYKQKHPELSKKQLTPFRAMYIRNWKLLVKNPGYTFGLFILKFTEYLGAFIGLMTVKR